MKQYQTYIFDFDGTTFDSASTMGPVFRAGFEAIGRTCTDEQGQEYMHHSIEALAKAEHFEDRFEEFINAVAVALDWPETIAATKVFPDAEEALKELRKRGKKIGIMSGNITSHINLVLRNLKMEDAFDVVVGSDLIQHPKPAPDGILLACERLGVKADRDVLYIGDSEQDIQAAEAAGVDGVLIDRPKIYEDLNCLKVKTLIDLLS